MPIQPLPAQLGQDTTPTEVLHAKEKFDHNQSFLSWSRRNRRPGIRKLRQAHKPKAYVGAIAANLADYLTTNTINTDFYSKYESTIEALDNPPSQDDEAHSPEPSVRQQDESQSRMAEQEALKAEETKAEIEAFSKKFKDQTYVPSPEEYETMSDLAGDIRITHTEVRPDLYEDNRIKYVVGVGAAPIDSYAARSFLDTVRADRWKLSEKGLEEANKTLEVDSLPGLNAFQQHRRRERKSDFLGYDEYMIKRKEPVDPNSDVIATYHDYLEQRIDLNTLIIGMEAEQRELGQEAVEPHDIAMNALKSFTDSRKKTRLNIAGRLRR